MPRSARRLSPGVYPAPPISLAVRGGLRAGERLCPAVAAPVGAAFAFAETTALASARARNTSFKSSSVRHPTFAFRRLLLRSVFRISRVFALLLARSARCSSLRSAILPFRVRGTGGAS